MTQSFRNINWQPEFNYPDMRKIDKIFSSPSYVNNKYLLVATNDSVIKKIPN